MPEVGVGFPCVVGGVISGPAHLELECSSVIEGATVGDNMIDEKFFCVQQSKVPCRGWSAKERRQPLAMEEMFRLQKAVGTADIISDLILYNIGPTQLGGKLGCSEGVDMLF